MEKTDILKQVQDIFRDILDDENIILSDASTAEDIEDWDSLTHIQLIKAIEKNFSIRFTSREILSWNNVGEMLDCIKSKL
ncbi:MAG: acyl carrier protein [Bacteroidales bacterium]|jgi:acyl carrier protein|nr:acyl carrier protein [Bacteroidaceae bacterium]MBR6973332.1 acyl carrier protein [Bacteroidaceae bacterium]MDO4201575.1 acyl carrier protein [Bacteroidales bacterium]